MTWSIRHPDGTSRQAILALYEHPDNEHTSPTNVVGSMLKTPLTPVDSSTVFTLTFSAAKLSAQASLSCSITLNSMEPGVTIRFERGSILISSPIYCPKQFVVQYLGKDGKLEREEKKTFEYAVVGGTSRPMRWRDVSEMARQRAFCGATIRACWKCLFSMRWACASIYSLEMPADMYSCDCIGSPARRIPVPSRN